MTATGAGWGDPLERPLELVKEDLKNGYITLEQANRYYSLRDLCGMLAVYPRPHWAANHQSLETLNYITGPGRVTMVEPTVVISIVVSFLSLIVSGLTAWLTLLRKGTVKMTQPSLVAFAFDLPQGTPKVFLRTLLFSTAKRGRVVENMFIKMRRSESVQAFSMWGYGDEPPLVVGGGVYVPPEGMASYHHFLLRDDQTPFEFLPGEYAIEVYASILRQKSPLLLYRIQLSLSEQLATAIVNKEAGVIFNWGPESGQYLAHLMEGPRERFIWRS
jgi:hypothetical protein